VLSRATLDDLAAIEDGNAAAMRRVLEQTGRLVGPRDVTAAEGSTGLAAFAESLSDPPDDLSAISDADATGLLTTVMAVAHSEADTHRALAALGRAFDQPGLTDLIYWPRKAFEPAEVVRIARTKKGAALVPFLDPQCGVPAERCSAGPSLAALSTARRVLLTLAEQEALELHFGELAAQSLASAMESSTDPDAIVERLLSEVKGIGEVYADDDTLREALRTQAAGWFEWD